MDRFCFGSWIESTIACVVGWEKKKKELTASHMPYEPAVH